MKLTREEKQEIKEKIGNFEYNNSGLSMQSGGYAECRNLKFRYSKNKIAVSCDIVSGISGERKEVFNDCEYKFSRNPIKMIKISEYEAMQ